MKPISSRPIFTLAFFASSNQKIIKNSHFLAFSTQTHQNSYIRRHEEESRAVRVSVWWDFENCHIPVNTNAFKVAQCIINAVRANGIKGPIQITAFGDVMQVSRTNQEALSSTGISLTHVPSGGKNSADRSLLVDLMYWVSQNPPPAHIFLISGDRDFAGILHRLRMNNYNILLASPDSAPNVLCCAATVMWQWSTLLKGENLTGKLFNQPPDGPYHSWYGHYKAPLEDPFAVSSLPSGPVTDKPCDVAPDSKVQLIPEEVVSEQSSYLGANESCDAVPNPRFRPIPKAVVKYISHILRSYPEGIAITQLRNELIKSNLTMDRDLYGYKKFSRFLSAMPHILELQSGNDGLILVRRVNTRFLDESASSGNGEPEVGNARYCEDMTVKSRVHPASYSKVKVESTNLQEAGKEEKQNGSSPSKNMQDIKKEACSVNLHNPKKVENRKTPLPKRNTQEIHGHDINVKLQKQTKKVEVAPPVVEMKDSSEKNEKKMLVPNDCTSTAEFGVFRSIWMKLIGSRDIKSDGAPSPALFSPSSHETLAYGRSVQSGGAVSNISGQDSSFFNRATSWFKFWSSQKFDNKVAENGESANPFEANTNKLYDNKVERTGETGHHFEVNPEQLEIFGEESFWKEIEAFIDSSQGSASISKSMTREHLAQNLQKQGPPVLKCLLESDLLHLVDLLITDKKWVEECNFRIFPFRLIHHGKDPQKTSTLSSNGLSHIFSGRQPNQQSGERKHQNPPHAGVSQPVVPRSSLSKARSELLADCKVLVDQIVMEHPEGFSIGGFRKLFLEKHGYSLDLQELGYDKLVNLLQIMPGVRVESNLILPAESLKNLDLQNLDLSTQESKAGVVVDTQSDPKDDDSDSWDELGPVENSGSEKEEMDMRSFGKRQNGRTEQRLPDYEPLKEDDFSDSDEETHSTRSDNEHKSKSVDEEGSLLEILDSWYTDTSPKGDGIKKNETTGTANVTHSEEVSSQRSMQTKNGSTVVKPTRKHKPSKSYSFVSEQPVDESELVDGILGSLKKSGEKSGDSQVC